MPIRKRLSILLLVTAAAAGSVACSGEASAPPPRAKAPAGAIWVRLVDYMIEPATIQAPAGRVVFYVTDAGQSPHNFDLRQPAGALSSQTRIVAHTKDLKPGESTILVATLRAGTYTFFCAFAGHEELGMSGTLTIT